MSESKGSNKHKTISRYDITTTTVITTTKFLSTFTLSLRSRKSTDEVVRHRSYFLIIYLSMCPHHFSTHTRFLVAAQNKWCEPLNCESKAFCLISPHFSFYIWKRLKWHHKNSTSWYYLCYIYFTSHTTHVNVSQIYVFDCTYCTYIHQFSV